MHSDSTLGNHAMERRCNEGFGAVIALNVGCGPIRKPGEIGVDLYDTGAVDVRGDLHHLPFRNGSVDSLRIDHVLEHQEARRAVPALLECQRVLRHGGLIRVGLPDMQFLAWEFLRAKTMGQKAAALRQVYGSQIHRGEYHSSGWDQLMARDLLVSVGFISVQANEDHGREEAGGMVVTGYRA